MYTNFPMREKLNLFVEMLVSVANTFFSFKIVL